MLDHDASPVSLLYLIVEQLIVKVWLVAIEIPQHMQLSMPFAFIVFKEKIHPQVICFNALIIRSLLSRDKHTLAILLMGWVQDATSNFLVNKGHPAFIEFIARNAQARHREVFVVDIAKIVAAMEAIAAIIMVKVHHPIAQKPWR